MQLSVNTINFNLNLVVLKNKTLRMGFKTIDTKLQRVLRN